MAEPLHVLAKARIACSNSVHELEALNSMTDDWDLSDKETAVAALEIQLQCEFAAKEATSIHEILTEFATTGNAPSYLVAEIEVRQENAVAAAKEVRQIITQIAASSPNLSMELEEMGRRINFILPKFEVLGGLFSILQPQQPSKIHQKGGENES